VAHQLYLASNRDEPYAAVKREIGKYNVGLYCSQCSEFFALMVLDLDPPMRVEVVSEGPVLFECPLCHHSQLRETSEVIELVLTKKNKRKNPSVH
jgi:hypothetical protein